MEENARENERAIRKKLAESRVGIKHTRETKNKRAEAVRKHWASLNEQQRAARIRNMKGRIRGGEWRSKISQALKGRTLSIETKKKLSQVRKGRKLSEKHRLAIIRGKQNPRKSN